MSALADRRGGHRHQRAAAPGQGIEEQPQGDDLVGAQRAHDLHADLHVQCEMAQGSWDCTKPVQSPVANPKVRQAINYAVDVDSIIKNVLEGQGIRIATPLTSKHFGTTED